MPPVLRERKPEVENPTVAKTVKPRLRARRKRPAGSTMKLLELAPVPKKCQYCKTQFFDEYVCTEHEDICRKIPPLNTDLRDYPERKKDFASFLGLNPVVPEQECNNEEENQLERLHTHVVILPQPVSQVMAAIPSRRYRRRKRIAQSKALRRKNFLKGHPFLPITSVRWQTFLKKFWKMENPKVTSCTSSHEKYCNSKRVKEPNCNPKILDTKSKTTRSNEHIHKYSFSATDRISHNVELATGLSNESQKKLDQCTPVSVKIIRLDSKVVNEIQERDKKKFLASTESSKHTKKKSTPVLVNVELCDFVIHPNAIKDYVEKNNLKVKL